MWAVIFIFKVISQLLIYIPNFILVPAKLMKLNHSKFSIHWFQIQDTTCYDPYYIYYILLYIRVLYLILWQYGLWSFQTRYIKLERFLPKNQHTQRKFSNFGNWCNGEVSKVGIILVIKWFKKLFYQTMLITKKVLLQCYS